MSPLPTAFSKAPARCLSLPPHRFDPQSSPSRSSSLTLCKEYAASTCCNASHTAAVTKQLYPFYSFTLDDRVDGYGVSDDCRHLAVSVFCSPCHPLVGVGQLRGVCQESCDQWFTACSSSPFESVSGALQPCAADSLICSPLDAIVSSGRAFCDAMGVRVAAPAATASLSSAMVASASSSQLYDAVSSFLTEASSGATAAAASCFTASTSPQTTIPAPAAKRSSASSSSSPRSTSSSASTASTASSSSVSSLLGSFLRSLSFRLPRPVRRLLRRFGLPVPSGDSLVLIAVTALCCLLYYNRKPTLAYLRRKGLFRMGRRLTAEGLRAQRLMKLSKK